MKLNDLRQRIADAIAPKTVWQHNEWTMRVEDPRRPMPDPRPPDLEPLENPPLPPDPNQAQPLTTEQRANLEALRNRYAPDRQQRP